MSTMKGGSGYGGEVKTSGGSGGQILRRTELVRGYLVSCIPVSDHPWGWGTIFWPLLMLDLWGLSFTISNICKWGVPKRRTCCPWLTSQAWSRPLGNAQMGLEHHIHT
jgi:hypothetical protein